MGGIQDQVYSSVGDEVKNASDETQHNIDEPTTVVCEAVEQESVSNAQTEDDVYRPIMDGLEDYEPFHSHSEGQFVHDFVEAAAVFEVYLGRLNELDLENHVGETAHWPEVGDINTDLNLGGPGGATTTWPEEVNNVGRSCAPVVEEFSTEANQAGETDNGVGTEEDVNNGGNINLQAGQVEGDDDVDIGDCPLHNEGFDMHSDDD